MFLELLKKLFAASLCLSYPSMSQAAEIKAENAYEFSFATASGEEFSLKQFQGRVLLIVNTASKCGFTNQYAGLQKLYEKYKEQGLVIIGVPSNDFGGQEPGANAEIQNFCQVNFGVSFPIVGKEIVSGDKAHPFYKWAYQKLGFGSAPKWNFHKYLIDRNGQMVTYFNSPTAPESSKVINAIEKLLVE
jgi:glutathione peroxidase